MTGGQEIPRVIRERDKTPLIKTSKNGIRGETGPARSQLNTLLNTRLELQAVIEHGICHDLG